MFVFTFASPCHTFATDQLLQNDHSIHDCCIAPVALAQPTVHVALITFGFVEDYQLQMSAEYTQLVATLDNKSPPSLS